MIMVDVIIIVLTLLVATVVDVMMDISLVLMNIHA